MQEIGTFQAKTHFSELIEKVIHGEQFVVTKHDQKVAKIIPFTKNEFSDDFTHTINAMRKLRKRIGKIGVTLTEIKMMKEEGRS